jgi:signal peptidase I
MSIDSFSEDIPLKEFSEIDLIETVKEVLAKGKSVEIPATGYSMYPTLKPGDRVMVKPLLKDQIPVLGSIVVFRDNDQLIIHRLIRIFQNEEGIKCFEAKGDSRSESDKILPVKQLIGLAVSYKRKNKEHDLRYFKPGTIQDKYNRFTLWFAFKIRRLSGYFKLSIRKDEKE